MHELSGGTVVRGRRKKIFGTNNAKKNKDPPTRSLSVLTCIFRTPRLCLLLASRLRSKTSEEVTVDNEIGKGN